MDTVWLVGRAFFERHCEQCAHNKPYPSLSLFESAAVKWKLPLRRCTN